MTQQTSSAQLIPFPRSADSSTASMHVPASRSLSSARARQGDSVAAPRASRASEVANAGFLGLGGMRLTRRGRVIVWVVALSAALFTGVVVGGNAFADTVQRPQEIQWHAVGAGETLWDIAHHHAPERDPRDVVHEIREVNQLGSADLHVGEILLIPTS